MLQLTKADDFTNRRVPFNRYQLLRILGWRDEGKSYVRLDKSLKRWTGVTLYYENAWRDNRDKRWVNASFHLLDEVVLRGRSSRESTVSAGGEPSSYFTWNEIVFESFQAGYLKRLDLDFYRQLKLAAAKRIYRFLDKRFHFTSELRFNLASFAYEHVGLSRQLRCCPIETAFGTGNPRTWSRAGSLRRCRCEQRYQSAVSREVGNHACAGSEGTKNRWRRGGRCPMLEDRLVERGVSVSIGSAARAGLPGGTDSSKDRRLRRTDDSNVIPAISRNPAGFLVQSIRENYASPAGLGRELVDRRCCSDEPAGTHSLTVKRRSTKGDRSNGCSTWNSRHLPSISRDCRPPRREELERNAITQGPRLTSRRISAGREQSGNRPAG